LRCGIVTNLKLDPLAYMTAKAHGLTEECESILEATGLTEDQITLPTIGAPLSTPRAIVSTFKANWPTKATSQSFFEKALLGQVEGLSLEDEPVATSNGFGFNDVEENSASKQNGNLIEAEDEDDAAGWDMGDDIVPEVESDFVNVDTAEGGVGSSEAELWARNSPLAADHVAGGSFESAMQLLNRQVGAVNFAPLKPRFMTIYEASRTYLPASQGLPPLVNYVRRTLDETDPHSVLPYIPDDLESVASNYLQKGYDSVRGNKLEDGAVIFKNMLHTLLVNVVSSPSDVGEAAKLITSASEYSVAIAIELSRRKLGSNEEVTKSPEKLKRSLELSAYFTIPKLEVAHRQLALMSAMKLAYTHKNFGSALSFANRILANGGGAKVLEQVRIFLLAQSLISYSNETTGTQDQSNMRAQPQ
jgi:coatomer protein complex subunit alpha (xenin)